MSETQLDYILWIWGLIWGVGIGIFIGWFIWSPADAMPVEDEATEQKRSAAKP